MAISINKSEMTSEIANKYLEYDYNTGFLYRKYKYHTSVVAGKRACRPCNHKHQNHLSVVVCGRDYPAHRIIWLMVYGEFPKGHIDHIDHNETNNLLNNLRVVTQAENNMNNSKRKDNTTGTTGVWINKKNTYKKYMAEIAIPNGKKRTKSFYTIEEAQKQRKIWEKELGYHENHGKDKVI